MSFDLSELPTESEFMAANPTPAPPTPPTEEQRYANKITRIQKRIMRFFSQTSNGGRHEMTIFVAGLTEEDKTSLNTQIEAKGYVCVMDNNKLTISAASE